MSELEQLRAERAQLHRDHELTRLRAELAALTPTCALCGRTTPCGDDTACTFDPSPRLGLHRNAGGEREQSAAGRSTPACEEDVMGTLTDKEIDAIIAAIRLELNRKAGSAWLKRQDIERAIARHFLALGQKPQEAA